MSNLYLSNFDGFQWDAGNRDKNWDRHKVSIAESEEIFLNSPLFYYADTQHSEHEQRILALGITFDERLLAIVFTVRSNKIRVISARDMSKKERKTYEENSKEDSEI